MNSKRIISSRHRDYMARLPYPVQYRRIAPPIALRHLQIGRISSLFGFTIQMYRRENMETLCSVTLSLLLPCQILPNNDSLIYYSKFANTRYFNAGGTRILPII